MDFDADVIGRVAAAVALGAIVGFEREVADQPAGLRTHISVALGACLFGIVSTLGFLEFRSPRAPSNIQIDVTRVASQVVVGIGFLGAGVIFRQGNTVRNLTTAASLWVTAAIGLAVGVGDIGTALVTTIALTGSLAVLRPLRAAIRRWLQRDRRRIKVILRPGAEPGDAVSALHGLDGVEVHSLSVAKAGGAFVLYANVRSAPHVVLDDRLGAIARRDDVDTLADA
ncbi:MAG TPA: MgtC/SapB family protein [Acidimicrobiales bacterium]